MKKLKKILKNKSGTTLMELIIGMVISVIIAAYVSAILAPMLTVFNRSNDLAEVNALFDNISEEMINDFSRATAITVDHDNDSVTISTGYGDVVYTNLSGGTGNDILKRGTTPSNGIPVFAEGYYKRKHLIVEILPNGNITDSFTLNLSVNNSKEELLAERVYAVSPLFLEFEKQKLKNNE